MKRFNQVRASMIYFNGSSLEKKAMATAKIVDIGGSTPSNSGFRAGHDTSYWQVNGEVESINTAEIENWTTRLPSVINSHDPCNVCNAGELCIFFEVQPKKLQSLKGESCHGSKVSKRIAVLLCCTKDGSDIIRPWIIVDNWPGNESIVLAEHCLPALHIPRQHKGVDDMLLVQTLSTLS